MIHKVKLYKNKSKETEDSCIPLFISLWQCKTECYANSHPYTGNPIWRTILCYREFKSTKCCFEAISATCSEA